MGLSSPHLTAPAGFGRNLDDAAELPARERKDFVATGHQFFSP